MKSIVAIVILALSTMFCSSMKQKGPSIKDYLITKLDSIDDYYIIYAKQMQDGQNYKIISEKDESKCEDIILLGKKYSFEIESIFIFKINDNGIVREINNHVNIDCMILGETKICKEYENGIVDIYKSKNLKGLCYINN